MSTIYDLYSVSEDLETQGFDLVLVEPLEEGDATVSFKIARAGGRNKKWTKKVQQLLKPHQHAYDRGTLDDKISEKIFTRAIADTVVLGWENIFVPGEDGEAVKLEFTPDNCFKLLTDIPDLKEIVWEESRKISNFVDAERIENGKNSQTSSGGNSEEAPKPNKSKTRQSKED